MNGNRVADHLPDRLAFRLRQAGLDLSRRESDDLRLVPVVSEGTQLQQGATYIDLSQQPPREFTPRDPVATRPGDAYVPKDRVPCEVWNRLIGSERTRHD